VLSSNQTLLKIQITRERSLHTVPAIRPKNGRLKVDRDTLWQNRHLCIRFFISRISQSTAFGRVELCRDGKELSKKQICNPSLFGLNKNWTEHEGINVPSVSSQFSKAYLQSNTWC
jgi:hypothetical protein